MIYCRRHRLVERQDGVVGIMDMLKRVLAVLGATFWSLAMFYLVFAWSLTLKNFGSSVEAQLIAQRILTPLVFVALGALAASCEYFRRVFYIAWLPDDAWRRK